MVRYSWNDLHDKNYGGIRFHHIFQDYPIYHTHDYFEVFICTSGSYIQNIDDEKFYYSKYDCTFFAPNSSHAIINNEEKTGHYAIEINTEYFQRFCMSMCPYLYERLIEEKFKNYSISEIRFKKIVSYLNQIRDANENSYQRTIAISMLLFNLVEPIVTSTKLIYDNNHSKWLNDLLIEINKPENLSWSVSDVIKNSMYSHTHLSRLFKEEMGISLLQYLTDVKMANARDLLINTTIPLEEVRETLGYTSLSHFNNLFKKYYKITPGKYRSKNKNKYN